MAWQFPISTTSNINLGTTDSVVIAKQVIVNGGISGTGIGHEVRVKGTVAGSISLGPSNEALAANAHLSITSIGEVYSAVSFFGTGNLAENAGYWESMSTFALFIRGTAAGTTTINNTGEIIGNDDVINISATNVQTVVLNNSGLIQAVNDAYGPNSIATSSIDEINNTGKIVGDVRLGGMDDLYDGRKGSIDGIVDGEAGNDRLFGGKEANFFYGSAGSDTIQGGLGADELHGGTEADLFVFASLKDSTVKASDTIADFSQAEHDRIDLHLIDADLGMKGNQKFDFIGTKSFSGEAGELGFKIKDGDTFVYGDTDGDGKADFQIKLTGEVQLVKSDFLL